MASRSLAVNREPPMVTLFRWLFRLTLGLLALAGVAAVLAWWLAARSLPDYEANVEVAGLAAPVEIVRDNASVPHVFAATDADAFFALGYAHAQDRLWQMTMLRRTAQGRLSEVFGARTLPVDTLMRRLDLYRLATSSVEAQDPSAREALEAYSAGVNAWLGQSTRERGGAARRSSGSFPKPSHPGSPPTRSPSSSSWRCNSTPTCAPRCCAPGPP
jgi:penicillin amidase